jgi:chromosome segregation ATPase
MTSSTTPGLLTRTLGTVLLGFVLMPMATPASAQEMPQQQLPPEIQEMLEEFEEKREQVIELREAALEQNAELREREEAIGDQIEGAMRAVEPELDDLVQRMEALEREFQSAQQAQDMERLQSIMTQAQELDGRLQQAQAQALERDEVQGAIAAFEDDLMSAMKEIDPEAEEILERVQELAERLSAAQGPPMD